MYKFFEDVVVHLSFLSRTRCVTQDTPKLLGIESTLVILLPQVVICRVEDDVIGERAFDGFHSSFVILRGWDSDTVSITTSGPSGFGHYDGLSGGLANLVNPAFDEFAGFLGRCVSVEEGVAIDGAEVGCFADLRVIYHCNHSINSHNGTTIAVTLENATGLSNGADDRSRICAFVDHLIAHANGIDFAPVAFDGIGNRLSFLLDLGEVKDAEEELHIATLGSG